MAKRDFDDDYDDDDRSWWYGSEAAAIKWAVIGAIFLIALLWFFGGYYHAQRRMKKGLQPLAYHRWLLPRSQRLRYQGQNQFPYYHQHNGYDDAYQMQGYPAPPPAYNHAFAPPPSYQPPIGASKVNPDQHSAPPPLDPPPTSESSGAGHQIIPPLTQRSQSPENSLGEHPNSSVQPPKRSLMRRFNPFK